MAPDPAAHRRGGDVITVVIVDDHQLVRAGLRSLLDAVEDVRSSVRRPTASRRSRSSSAKIRT